ncbi:MAG: T9SS type A sorting domain-containing protein, partial [Mangrovimonas sp.]|nr:T9SS type A sorting domain-containing protein [Mangrovimonas sp.]
PSSCETFTYGEVEDYTVIISSTAREDVIGSVESAVNQFSIYPNPVKGNELNIRIDAEASEVTIFNMLGQIVKKQAFSQTVDVSLLENGIYILEVTVGSERLTKRFIKE